MELTKEQIKEINKSLEHGTKGILARHLGIHQSALSRYLSLQIKLNRTTGKIERKYIMPTEIYNKIVDFINQ